MQAEHEFYVVSRRKLAILFLAVVGFATVRAFRDFRWR